MKFICLDFSISLMLPLWCVCAWPGLRTCCILFHIFPSSSPIQGKTALSWIPSQDSGSSLKNAHGQVCWVQTPSSKYFFKGKVLLKKSQREL